MHSDERLEKKQCKLGGIRVYRKRKKKEVKEQKVCMQAPQSVNLMN